MSDPHYPDDIRKYDSDPRSPFYDSSAEDAMDGWIEERAALNMQEPALVFEATGELTEDEKVDIAKLLSGKATAADILQVGIIIQTRCQDYMQQLAEAEFELEAPYEQDGER